MLRVSSGFQTLENNKTTRPAASWFQMFSRVWKPDETLALVFEIVLNPRTYKQSCTTTMVQGGGGKIDGIPALEFCFESIVDVLYKMRYILWVVALLGACDVFQDGRQYGRHLGFFQQLEIIKNGGN